MTVNQAFKDLINLYVGVPERDKLSVEELAIRAIPSLIRMINDGRREIDNLVLENNRLAWKLEAAYRTIETLKGGE